MDLSKLASEILDKRISAQKAEEKRIRNKNSGYDKWYDFLNIELAPLKQFGSLYLHRHDCSQEHPRVHIELVRGLDKLGKSSDITIRYERPNCVSTDYQVRKYYKWRDRDRTELISAVLNKLCDNEELRQLKEGEIK